MRKRKTLEKIKPYSAGKKYKNTIKMSSNENPLGPSPAAIRAIKKDLKNINTYPDPACSNLKKALAKKYKVTENQIITGNGSDELMVMIAATYLNPGDNIITGKNTFSEYEFAANLMDAETQKAPMTDGSFNLDAILSLINSKTRIIFICNPNNPTGTYIGKTKILDFIKKIPEDILVVFDHAYAEYVTAADYPSDRELIDSKKNVVILHTFSKVYGLAGLRIGYAISSPERIADISLTKQPFNNNIPAQKAALAALSDDGFLKKSQNINEKGKKYLYKELKNMGLFFYPTEANFICIRLDRDSREAFLEIAKRGVSIRALDSFGLAGWIRVTIGTEKQNRLFIKALSSYLSDKGV
ncbi:histidinol-phosphate transaminase [Spirochaetia bacterium 38H-sp]|uniref:Histidinol-phosphate aminotransferase n=1 Tax=Rarispira pelagica TaxID=3141764 RepID=A0ABU9UC19_9SPIR